MNETLAFPQPDNIMINDTNTDTPRTSMRINETKTLTKKSYVQCEPLQSTLHEKIHRFIGNVNKTISKSEFKPYKFTPEKIMLSQKEQTRS